MFLRVDEEAVVCYFSGETRILLYYILHIKYDVQGQYNFELLLATTAVGVYAVVHSILISSTAVVHNSIFKLLSVIISYSSINNIITTSYVCTFPYVERKQ